MNKTAIPLVSDPEKPQASSRLLPRGSASILFSDHEGTPVRGTEWVVCPREVRGEDALWQGEAGSILLVTLDVKKDYLKFRNNAKNY